MKSFNRVILIGNLVHDPALRGDPAAPICAFSIAVNESKKAPSGAWTTEPHYFDITCFGKVAENVAQYLKKGDPVLIEGNLHQSRWDDKNTGQKRQKVGVLARDVVFLPRGGNSKPETRNEELPDAPPVDEGDIPF